MQRNLSKILQTAYLTHPALLQRDMGPLHPECPQRLAAIKDRLIAAGIWDYLLHEIPDKVTLSCLQSVHTPAYLAKLAQMVPQEGMKQVDLDTFMNPYSLNAAFYAAGAAQKAVGLCKIRCKTLCVQYARLAIMRAQIMPWDFVFLIMWLLQ